MSEDNQLITRQDDAGVARLTLNQPRSINALSEAMLLAHEMTHVWQWQNRKRTGYHPLRAAAEQRQFEKVVGWNLTEDMLVNLERTAEEVGLPFEAVSKEELCAQADVIIVCHEVGREQMDLMEGYPVPDLADVINTNLQLGALTNPSIRLGGIALNTSSLSEEEAQAEIARYQAQFGVPVVDPVRTGVAAIVDALEVAHA